MLIAPPARRSADTITLQPAEIGKLLHEGAQRRGWPIDTYHSAVNRLAWQHSVTFQQGLQIVAHLDALTPEQQQALYKLKEAAARSGVSAHAYFEFVQSTFDIQSNEKLEPQLLLPPPRDAADRSSFPHEFIR